MAGDHERDPHAPGEPASGSPEDAPEPGSEPAGPGGLTGHGHGHAHDIELDLPRVRERVVAIIAIVVGLATIVGLVWLWPDGTIRERADELGVTTDRYDATVIGVEVGPCSYSTEEAPRRCQVVDVRLDGGPEAGDELRLGEYSVDDPFAPDLAEGDALVVGYEESTDFYFYADRQRRPALWLLTALFAVVVVAFGRWRGVTALIALALTLVVVVAFVVPAVLEGTDAVLVAVVGSAAVAYLALYTTHGLRTMTTAALLGTLVALVVTLVLGLVFFELAEFSGAVDEEAAFLPLVAEDVDVTGLLLGGVIIGALGAVDDVVITQAATVWELRAAGVTDRRATRRAAMRVGRDHIGSIINTLMLAYVGASMPLLILFHLSGQSLGAVANSEAVAVEIVRTLVGSLGLLAAVPATTWLAAYLTDPRSGDERLAPADPSA